MKIRSVPCFVAVACAFLLGSVLTVGRPAGAEAAEKLLTAKAALKAAVAEAGKWQPDAALTYVESKTALADGTAYTWIYVFDSPQAKQQIAVMVDEKGRADRLPSGTAYKRPVGEFVDSDRAMSEAIKNGLEVNDWGMSVSLHRRDRAEWQFLDKHFFYYVDAESGRFLRKEKTD